MNISSIVPKVRCPKCGSKTLECRGKIKGELTYRCRNCNHYFWKHESEYPYQVKLDDYE